MKKAILLFFAFIGTIAYAQETSEKADFTLLPDGSFVTSSDDKKSYIVIPFDGQTDKEIYQKLIVNASLVVNNPSEQVSGVEYSLIKARTKQHLLTHVLMGLPLSCTGTIIYEFQIKDGRVRVNAPMVEEPCKYGTSDQTCYFSDVVKGYFKKGKLKEKKANEFNQLIDKTNKTINTILGLEAVEKSEEDW